MDVDKALSRPAAPDRCTNSSRNPRLNQLPVWRLAVANKPKLHQTSHSSQHLAAALPTKTFAAKYGVHPSTVWRAVRDGRLQYIVVGRRKLILPPVVQGENSSANPPRGKKMRP